MPVAATGTTWYVRLYSKTPAGVLGDQFIPADLVLNQAAIDIQAFINQLSGTVAADNTQFDNSGKIGASGEFLLTGFNYVIDHSSGVHGFQVRNASNGGIQGVFDVNFGTGEIRVGGITAASQYFISFYANGVNVLASNALGTSMIFGAVITIPSTVASVAGSGTDIVLGATTQTTIGANGAASALTAAPLGYLVAFKGTTKIVIPYYNG